MPVKFLRGPWFYFCRTADRAFSCNLLQEGLFALNTPEHSIFPSFSCKFLWFYFKWHVCAAHEDHCSFYLQYYIFCNSKRFRDFLYKLSTECIQVAWMP